MSYRENGDQVTLEMSRDDYEILLIMMGVAVGCAMREDRDLAFRYLAIVNRLNAGNPGFMPYTSDQPPWAGQ